MATPDIIDAAIEPSRLKFPQAGKVIVITGASRGLRKSVKVLEKYQHSILIKEQGFAASFARANAVTYDSSADQLAT